MPLPTPNDGEKRSKFIERCMLDLSEKNEFPDAKQRTAVCYSQFKKAESKASVVVGDDSEMYYYFSESSEGPMSHYFKTKEEALSDGSKMGLDGYHVYKNEAGDKLYMAGPDYKTFSSLWENIRKKKQRIKSGSGEKMREKGDKGAPTPEQIKKAKD